MGMQRKCNGTSKLVLPEMGSFLRHGFIMLAAIFFSAVQYCYADIVIRHDTEAAIAISRTPSETERFAAEELKKYLNEMIGIDLPINDDIAKLEGIVIAVGRNRYSKGCENRFDESLVSAGSDSFIIKVQGKSIVLIGGADRGTIYSVYEFLEQQGCRWFYPGKLGEIVPNTNFITVKEGDCVFEPDFVQRSIGGGHLEEMDFEQIVDWSVKNRINWRFGFRDYFVRKHLPVEKWNVWAKRGGQLNWEWICHNFTHMMPNNKYFAQHPEYYSFYKGERIELNEKGSGGGNLCTTNPDVVHLCAEFVIDWFDKNPDGMVVPLWPADGVVKWCECKDCSALGGRNFVRGGDGSMSRRVVTFANAVARLVYPKYPDRYILCPAYANYLEPVPHITLEKNVLVQYCLHGCYSHGVDKCETNLDHQQRMLAWRKATTGAIGVWEYFLIGDFGPQKVTPAFLPVTYSKLSQLS